MENVLNRFLNEFPISIGYSENPYIILIDAYTGMGKSTIANLIAKFENAVILNNDEVRSFLNDYGDKTNLKNQLQKYRLEALLKKHNNCIIDSCFCHNYKEKLEYFKKLGYRYYIIRLECSDETVKDRLEKRTIDGSNYSNTDYNDYLWMKNNVERVPLDLITYTINTENELELQVKCFLSIIKDSTN